MMGFFDGVVEFVGQWFTGCCFNFATVQLGLGCMGCFDDDLVALFATDWDCNKIGTVRVRFSDCDTAAAGYGIGYFGSSVSRW